MRKYVVELIGTFFLVLTIGLAVINNAGIGPLAPLAIGSALMVMIYAGGHISGGHYNPAVTLAVFLRGRCSIVDVPFYMLAQVLGAVGAALLVLYFKDAAHPSAGPADIPKALLGEFLFTFALAYVVLNVATSKATAGNSNYGLAIGFTVMVGAFTVGPISGGAFNPAVVVGVTLLGLLKIPAAGLYLLADFGGGAVAAILFKFLNPDDK